MNVYQHSYSGQLAMFRKNFFLVKNYARSSKYEEGGGGEVVIRNGVRASLLESFFGFLYFR